jgi:hypothetical protein
MLDAEVSRERLLELHVDTAGGTLVLELPEKDLKDSRDKKDREPCDPAIREREALTMPLPAPETAQRIDALQAGEGPR